MHGLMNVKLTNLLSLFGSFVYTHIYRQNYFACMYWLWWTSFFQHPKHNSQHTPFTIK